MKYRTLGKTDLRVSVVGVGAWQFGGEWGHDYTPDEAKSIVDKAGECGINLIDTAECYGDHLSESLVGQAVEAGRDKWIIATKFGHKFHGFVDRTEHWTADEVQRQLEDSLQALRTDYIDIYQFHSGTNDVFEQDDLWGMLSRQVEAGKVRHLGISVSKKFGPSQTDKASEVNAEAIQVLYNRLERAPEEDILPSCQKQNLGVLVRVPLASGFLSGKYKPGDSFPQNDVRGRRQQQAVDETLRRVQEIQRSEVPDGVPMAQWALAWCLQHPAVTCVIPGCKNAEQVESNAKAANLDMVGANHPQAS